jgi:hypothetical protein
MYHLKLKFSQGLGINVNVYPASNMKNWFVILTIIHSFMYNPFIEMTFEECLKLFFF